MAFTRFEQHVLAAVRRCVRRKTTPTEQALGEHFQDLSQLPELNDCTAQFEEWRAATASLVEKGLLIREDEAYALTEQGQAYARQFAKQLSGQFYSRWGFEVILALDTLYFVEDLPGTLARMAEMLAPDGRMGLFWSETVEPDDPKERLRPDKTRLAEALAETGLRFHFWDLTHEERELWVRSVALAEELRPAFDAEGNRELYKSIVLEAQDAASYVEAGRISRSLYCCRAAAGTAVVRPPSSVLRPSSQEL